MIRIEVQGETPEGVLDKIGRLFGWALMPVRNDPPVVEKAAGEGTVATTAPTDEAASVVPAAGATEQQEAPKRRRGRPRKEEPQPQPEPKAEEPAPADNAAPTKDDVNAALQKVVEAKGMEVARKLLGDAGFTRLSEVPEDKYAEVIAACEAKVAEKDAA